MRDVKWLAALLVSLALIAACGGQTGGGQTSHKLRIGLVLPPLTNQTINDIYLGAKARAQEIGIDLTEGGGVETPVWMNACQKILSSKVDILIYDSLDAQGTSKCVTDANKAGIKVICLFACTAQGHQDVTISLDFKADGATIGKWMANAVAPSGEVAMLRGPLGDEAITTIENSFKDTLASGCSGCKLVADVPGGNDRNSGYTVGLQVLTAHPAITGMYCANDDIALGCLRALQQIGKAEKVQLAGHNGTCDALSSLLTGKGLKFTMLIAGGPFGIAVVDVAKKLYDGQKVEATQFVNPYPLDTKTAQDILGGSKQNPPGIDVKSKLQKAQSGCS